MLKKFLNWEQKFTISKAAIIVGIFTLLSRLIGLLRDRLFASHFGAGDALDVYYAAFRIPDFIFNLLVLGTLSVAFIPVFTELLVKDKPRAYKNANTVLNVSGVGMAIICFFLILGAKQLSHLLVPGFTGAKFDNMVIMTRIFLISPIIFTLSNVFSSILNSQKKFIVTGIAPIMYNIGIIGGLLVFYPLWGLSGLAFGVIIGALLHLLIQIPEAIRHGYRWQPVFELKDEAFRRMAKLFIPRIFGLDNSQISLLIGSVVGSVLVSGSVAVFNLANNLQAAPLGIFAISIAIAAFPVLSEEFAAKDEVSFAKTLAGTMIQILFFIIPISILTLLLRAHIVRLAFGAGKFDWNDTILTLNTLGVFSLSFFSQALAPLLSRAFYARQNTITPVIINLFSMALNAYLAYQLGTHVYNFNLNFGFYNLAIRTGGVVGVALGFTLASIFNFIALFAILWLNLRTANSDKKIIQAFDNKLIVDTLKILTASLTLGIICHLVLYLAEPLLNTATFFGLLIQAGLATTAGLVAFFACGWALKLKQSNDLLFGVAKRLGFGKVVKNL